MSGGEANLLIRHCDHCDHCDQVVPFDGLIWPIAL